MIERLEVRNYRALRHLDIPDLTRLNLIAGRNNSGKTSLLEAIFLLAGAGNPRTAVNPNIIRMGDENVKPNADSFRETLWKPMFAGLDTTQTIMIGAADDKLGKISLELYMETEGTVKIDLLKAGPSEVNVAAERMSLRYSSGEKTVAESACRLAQHGAEITHVPLDPPFTANIILARNGSNQEDAVRLGELRKRKQGDVLLKALRIVEPRLQSIEDNSASGIPLIWGDVGLHELVPLPVMGEGMSRIARLVLAIATSANGIVLVDEVENGIHHSVLEDMWRVIDEASRQFDAQVFATTHSFECVQAANKALPGDDLSMHRLEVDDTHCRCVSYARQDIAAAIKHNLEVR